MFRFIHRIIEKFDNEDHEYEIRFEIWRMKWLPYKTAEFLGYNEETLEMDLGPWKWHKPDVLRKRKL